MSKDIVQTYISIGLYREIQEEKRRLERFEAKKKKSRKKIITLYHASQSLLRKLKKC